MQKALGTAKEKWELLMDDKLSEADKLAKMNKEEKAQYLHQKKEKELAEQRGGDYPPGVDGRGKEHAGRKEAACGTG